MGRAGTPSERQRLANAMAEIERLRTMVRATEATLNAFVLREAVSSVAASHPPHHIGCDLCDAARGDMAALVRVAGAVVGSIYANNATEPPPSPPHTPRPRI
jgi:hypothetical protein